MIKLLMDRMKIISNLKMQDIYLAEDKCSPFVQSCLLLRYVYPELILDICVDSVYFNKISVYVL